MPSSDSRLWRSCRPPLRPVSLPQEGVPKGQIRGPFTLPCEVFPGTQHTYWVYVPAQYDPKVPAALMIFQDGQAFMNPNGDMRAQNVMDNLIYRREIPVMIGVFINPGRRPDQPEPSPRHSPRRSLGIYVTKGRLIQSALPLLQRRRVGLKTRHGHAIRRRFAANTGFRGIVESLPSFLQRLEAQDRSRRAPLSGASTSNATSGVE